MAEPLKNRYDRPFFAAITQAFTQAHPSFDGPRFLELIFDEEWEARELKERMRHTSLTLGKILPAAFPDSLEILKNTAAILLQEPPQDIGFLGMFFPDFVEVWGIEAPDLSLPALAYLTQLASSEFAIRPFLIRYPDQSLEMLVKWAEDENQHVRRLASEGSRPRLPWAMGLPAFKQDPTPVLQILEQLRDDPELYVRRSVANHLNDISKDNPQMVIDTLMRWKVSASKERLWIIRHATRTLIKAGYPEALELMGFSPSPEVELRAFDLSPDRIEMGESVRFSFEIHSTSDQPQPLVIDYLVHFMKANGKRAPKVFKLTEKTLKPGEVLRFEKKHTIKPISTRKYYPGEQQIEVQVNGKRLGVLRFELEMD